MPVCTLRGQFFLVVLTNMLSRFWPKQTSLLLWLLLTPLLAGCLASGPKTSAPANTVTPTLVTPTDRRSAPPPRIDSGAITVLSTNHQIDFPNGIEFIVEAQAEQEIVDVRLFYTFTASMRTVYLPVRFTPGQRVRASYRLQTFIPPGTPLEYHFLITDASGNSLTTDTVSLMYIDPRFKWNTTEAGFLKLFWHDLSPALVEGAVNTAMARLEEIVHLLGLEKIQTLTGVVYNSASEASTAFRTRSSQLGFEGLSFRGNRVFIAVQMTAPLIAHETTHLLLSEVTDLPPPVVPSWLHEGLASYAEPGTRPQRISQRENARLPLSRMTSLAVAQTSKDIKIFYEKSEGVVTFLVRNYDASCFRRFIGQLRLGKGVDAALQAVYGFDVDGLESAWLQAQAEGRVTRAVAKSC